MKVSDILLEKTLFNPDVSWVEPALSSISWEDAGGDVNLLCDMLNDAFSHYKIEFQPALKSEIDYGSGAFTDNEAKKVGIPGAELIGDDPLMIIKLTSKTAKFPKINQDIVNVIKRLIKHELVHYEQNKLANGKIGGSFEGDDYYADPHEIGAIATEIETQLLAIEPFPPELINKIKSKDDSLLKSDRYRLYVNMAKEDAKFQRFFNRMLKTLISRLQNLKHTGEK